MFGSRCLWKYPYRSTPERRYIQLRMSKENIANSEPARLIRIGEVMARTSASRPTIYKKMAVGEFPKTVKMGRASFWVAGEIDSWIRERIAASRGEAAAA